MSNFHVGRITWASHTPDNPVEASMVKYKAYITVPGIEATIGGMDGVLPDRGPFYESTPVEVYPAPVGSHVACYRMGGEWVMLRPFYEYDAIVDPCEELENGD